MIKQKLFLLNENNLDEINKLLDDGYSMGNQFHTHGGTNVFVVLQKYTAPANNGSLAVHPFYNNGIY